MLEKGIIHSNYAKYQHFQSLSISGKNNKSGSRSSDNKKADLIEWVGKNY